MAKIINLAAKRQQQGKSLYWVCLVCGQMTCTSEAQLKSIRFFDWLNQETATDHHFDAMEARLQDLFVLRHWIMHRVVGLSCPWTL